MPSQDCNNRITRTDIDGTTLLKTIPYAVPGALLLFRGIDLAGCKNADLFLVLLMAAIGVALNPAVAFSVGLPLAFAVQRGWLKI